jgi:GNAT superfamily N-acetyltransferase
MTGIAVRTELNDIQPLRALYLQETNFQIRYHACHERGWTDSYLLTIDDLRIGYGSIKGQELAGRDTVFEFFVILPFRKFSSLLFRELLSVSGAGYIECQSNDALLSAMLYELSTDIRSDVVLFQDHEVTDYTSPEVVFRSRLGHDQVFEHQVEPIGDYILAHSADVMATGGFMRHYNWPFADLYMEVREDCRGRGYGTFLLQELKKECYLSGRVPAARCDLQNTASRATLIKAGFRVCGFMLKGKVRTACL